MANYSATCDVKQGYDFNKDEQATVGFITTMKIGGKELKANQTVKDPLAPTSDLAVVAVISDASWDTGPTDTVYLSGQISTTNKQVVAMLALSDLAKVEVTFKFTIYEYDPVASTYYKCFHTDDKDLTGILERVGKSLTLGVAKVKSTEVTTPDNYLFNIGIAPTNTEQKYGIATSNTEKTTKNWGIKVST